MRRLSLALFFVFLALGGTAGAADKKGPTVQECATASNKSVKLRVDHKLREARDQLIICANAHCPAVIHTECVRRMDQLVATIPTIVFEAKDPLGKDLAKVRVTIDGEVVAEQLDGSALALDPGSHEVTFEVEGQPPVNQTLIFREGDKERHVPVVIGTPPPPPPAPVPVVAPPVEVASSGDARRTRRIAGLAVGGVGVAGVVMGGVFGGLTFSAWSSANKACPTHSGCSPAATSDRGNAVTFGTISDVGFIAGGVLAAAGVTLFLTAPKDHAAADQPVKDGAPTAALELVPGGLRFTGSF